MSESGKTALAILGSPRRQGNLGQMLDAAVEAAKQASYTVEYLDLSECRIAPCAGCMGCKKGGVCVIDDDIGAIREALLRSRLVILAAPTYFANIPGPVKTMLDRLVGAVMDDNDGPVPKPRLSKEQEYLLLTACNTPAPFDRLAGQSSGALRAMREVFHIAGMRCRGQVVFAGTRGKTRPPERILRRIRRCFR